MSHADKLAAARAVLEAHNAALAADPTTQADRLDVDAIMSKVAGLGGTTEAALAHFTREDLGSVGIPKVLARQIANEVFRKRPEPAAVRPAHVSERRAAQMSVRELVEAYDPSGRGNEFVNQRLGAMLRGAVGPNVDRPAVFVYAPDGRLAIDETVRLIDELLEGLAPPAQVTLKGGQVVAPVRAGQRPAQRFRRNPLFPTQPLRSNLTCSVSGVSWPDHNALHHFLMLAVESGELVVKTAADVQDVYERVEAFGPDEALARLRKRCPKAAAQYDSLAQDGQLPSLTITATATAAARPNDPFFAGHRRT